jgi:hypothetical protein
MSFLRTFLTLGRASNLPTVWSNCLAGWWLGGAGNAADLPFLLVGASFLYAGGGFLNDSYDVAYDREHRRGRPIPTGAISAETVWRWSLVWLALGLICLFAIGPLAAALGVGLVLVSIIYDVVHRLFPFSPALLGLCRCLLYLLGATCSLHGITGWPVWCGLALAIYATGLGLYRRWERLSGPVPWWPAVLLLAPVGLAMLMNPDEYRQGALLLSAVLVLWVARSLRPGLWSAERNLSSTVLALQAGIILVDWLAVVDAPRLASTVTVLGLVSLTVLLQHLLPPD